MSFSLHAQLEKESFPISDLSLCKVLLMNNRLFPWLVLVPKREGMRELFDLTPDDYKTAMAEIHDVSVRFCKLRNAHKINVAALGNVVSQLHIHIIARFENDTAWPDPVWGKGSEPYAKTEAAEAIVALQKMLAL